MKKSCHDTEIHDRFCVIAHKNYRVSVCTGEIQQESALEIQQQRARGPLKQIGRVTDRHSKEKQET